MTEQRRLILEALRTTAPRQPTGFMRGVREKPHISLGTITVICIPWCKWVVMQLDYGSGQDRFDEPRAPLSFRCCQCGAVSDVGSYAHEFDVKQLLTVRSTITGHRLGLSANAAVKTNRQEEAGR